MNEGALTRALLSIYHYGRRNTEPLAGRPQPLTVWPLHRAVTTIIRALEDGTFEGMTPLSALRLALADLCRTRFHSPDSDVQRQIERLAAAYAAQFPHSAAAAGRDLVRAFTRMANEQFEDEHKAYARALQHLAASTPVLHRRESNWSPKATWTVEPGVRR